MSTALVGSERRAAPDTAATGVSVPSTGRDPAEVLLDRAALLETERRAGHVSGHVAPLPVAPAEDQPVVGLAAGHRLGLLLADASVHGLLEEWLALVSEQGLRVPEQFLPDLLERGRREQALRPLVARVAGRRGWWLAGLSAGWAYVRAEAGGRAWSGGDADPEVWELGSSDERRGHLARLRGRDPARARELLAASWAQEEPEDRAAFLAVLGDGLSAADEAFLEGALDDRRQAVREQAAELLARLPGSALGRRMAERAAGYLELEQRLLGARLAVHPPAECDRAMQRDGVRRRAPSGADERGWWLQQVVARTPLGTWTGRLGATPAAVLRLKPTGWAGAVRRGWRAAAVSQRDADWADALLAHPDVEGPKELLAVASPAGRQAYALRLLGGHHRNLVTLAMVPGPWTGELAERVLDTIRWLRDDWYLQSLCGVAGRRLPPHLHARVAGLVREPPRAIRGLADTLRFRHDMLEELK